jgi:hypothetical protein
MPFIQPLQDVVIEGLNRGSDKDAAGALKGWKQVGVPAQVLDFDRDVVAQLRKFCVEPGDDSQRMSWRVEEIRISEGDVLGAGSYLLTDVIEHRIGLDDPEPAAVDGYDRAMSAQVLASS